MNYETVKRNWIEGLWGLAALKAAYKAGIITKAQYKEIKALPQNQ